METITLEAETRETLSRGKLNAMRKEGWTPAVLYGGTKKAAKKSAGGSTLLRIGEKNFLKKIGGAQKASNAVIELKWGKDSANAVIKEVQRDVVTRKLIHVDFQKIVMTEKLEVLVPVRLVGEAPGVKLSGGILEHITRELKIICLPKDIPQAVEIDVSKLEIGQGLSVSDIKPMEGVQILSDPHQLVANVVAPTVLEETAVAAAPTTAEPEVIAKGKKPEEGQEGAAAPAKGGAAPAKAGEKPAAAPAAGKPAGK